ncbi:hypothetical protein EX30DRAFT_203863 [Ascodesmis nigricans]|uniref:Uncharacterized protein n=1 Tax=Ascodesmis nigricans TaxID=341454 RepID=A0A4S2MRA2_9PEZI|nr:hypothetical protein EX30DRAFT_203863 [Ascodesmis nigricans]
MSGGLKERGRKIAGPIWVSSSKSSGIHCARSPDLWFSKLEAGPQIDLVPLDSRPHVTPSILKLRTFFWRDTAPPSSRLRTNLTLLGPDRSPTPHPSESPSSNPHNPFSTPQYPPITHRVLSVMPFWSRKLGFPRIGKNRSDNSPYPPYLRVFSCDRVKREHRCATMPY